MSVRHWAVRAVLGLAVGAVTLAAGIGGVGMLAGAGYLALRASHPPGVSAAVVGGVLLAVCGAVIAAVALYGRRAAVESGAPAQQASGIPPELRWIMRDPRAASAVALLFGVGAGRSPNLRRLLRTLLKEWMALRR